MKYLVCNLIFSLLFLVDSYAENSSLPEDNKFKNYIFLLNSSGNGLFIQRNQKKSITKECYNEYFLFLKDSYMRDIDFKKQCVGEIPSYPQNYDDLDFDPYNPGNIFPPDLYIPLNASLYHNFFFYKGRPYFGKKIRFQSLYKNEIRGYKIPIWKNFMWDFVDSEFISRKRTLLITRETISKIYPITSSSLKSYEACINNGTIISLDLSLYKKILEAKKYSNYHKHPCFIDPPDIKYPPSERMDKLLEQSSLTDSYPNAFGEGKIPILLIDAEHHSERVDKDDWKVYSFLNSKNGDFFGYFIFEEQMNMPPPFFIRKWALDHLAGIHICQKSTVGIILNAKEKVVNKPFDMKKILFNLENNKAWKPEPVPENKNTLPEDRLFYREEFGRIFGSYSKIWELGIWERLGMMFKLNPKAEIYLCGYGTLLQSAETKTVEEEHALIKKCGVLMTAELYSEFEKLRKSPK